MKLPFGERGNRTHAAVRSATVALLGALVAAGSSGSAQAQQQPFKLRIGGQHPPLFEYVFWHTSIRNGHLKKYGIEGTFVGFTAGLTGSQALASGSIDVDCDGISGTVSAIAQGANMRILHMTNSDNTYAVLARDTVKSVPDLRGKKWGITQMGAISQTYAAMWLDAVGVKAEKGDVVDWVPVGGTSARVRAVIAGQIDAALITVGDWFSIRNEKNIKLLGNISDNLPPVPLSACSMSSKLIQERPDVAQGYVNASLDAVRHARTPEGKAEYMKAYKELNPRKMTDAEYEEIYEYYLGAKGSPFAIDPNGGMYPEILPVNIAMMVADKSIKAPLPLETVWDPRFVTAYLAKNGWFDVKTGKAGVYLRDLINRK